MIIYILSTYEEHGAENVKATRERSRLHELLDSYADYGIPPESHRFLDDLLFEYDRDPSSFYQKDTGGEGKNLEEGWGGLMLHIVELQ
jgi:hypothetical protein